MGKWDLEYLEQFTPKQSLASGFYFFDTGSTFDFWIAILVLQIKFHFIGDLVSKFNGEKHQCKSDLVQTVATLVTLWFHCGELVFFDIVGSVLLCSPFISYQNKPKYFYSNTRLLMKLYKIW